MKKSTILLTIIFLLLAVNVYLLWNTLKETQDPPQLSKNDRLAAWIKKDLGFSDDQVNQYIELRKKRDSILKPINYELRAARLEMLSLLGDTTNVSDTTIHASISKIAQVQYNMEMQYFNHFNRIYSICQPHQKPNLDTMLLKMVYKNTNGNLDSTSQHYK